MLSAGIKVGFFFMYYTYAPAWLLWLEGRQTYTEGKVAMQWHSDRLWPCFRKPRYLETLEDTIGPFSELLESGFRVSWLLGLWAVRESVSCLFCGIHCLVHLASQCSSFGGKSVWCEQWIGPHRACEILLKFLFSRSYGVPSPCIPRTGTAWLGSPPEGHIWCS